MHQVRLETALPFSPDAVWEWHTRPGAFERLSPPWRKVSVLETGEGIVAGEGKTLKVSTVGPLSTTWEVRHTAVEPGRGFIDEQVRGPFAAWRHEHWFEADGLGGTTLIDQIDYRLPLAAVAGPLAGGRIRDDLERTLRFRHARLAHDLGTHAAGSSRPLRIAITGASGLVGTQLTAFLTTGGHEVLRLVRREPAGPDEVRWDPEAGTIDAARLEGLDAVIHLAGVGIADKRWSRSRKQAILDSRVDGTTLIAETLARLQRPPRVLVSTSAVGYYGDRGSELLTEDAGPGEGFLSEVCQAWEASADAARAAGIRVVHPRLGVVITTGGSVVGRVTPIFQMGAGGRLGSGRQWMSWIALDDLLAILLHAIVDDSLSGPVNAVSPQPVTNHEFTAALGEALHRPTIFPAPAAALKLAFGELADESLLVSQRAVPAALAARGFTYSFPSVSDAIQIELGQLSAAAVLPRVEARRGASAAESVALWR